MKAISKIYFLFLFLGIFFVAKMQAAQAVLPPNLVFDISAQLWQFFSIIFVFFSSFFGGFFIFLKRQSKKFRKNRKPKLLYSLFAGAAVLYLSFSATFFYQEYKQNQEAKKWLQKEKIALKNQGGNNFLFEQKARLIPGYANFDYLHPLDYFDSNVIYEQGDETTQFIYNYYINLSRGNYSFCHSLSSKTMSAEEYQNYYSQFSKIEINDIVRIDANRSAFELIFYQLGKFEKYQVLLVLSLSEDGFPFVIESEEKALIEKGDLLGVEPEGFDNEDRGVKKEEFFKIKSHNDVLLLDVREEFEQMGGQEARDVFLVKDILQIRMADLVMGRWLELPRDKKIYVFCNDGSNRSQEVVNFLQQKGFVAFYIDGGLLLESSSQANYNRDKYSPLSLQMKVLDTKKVSQAIEKDNVVLVSSIADVAGDYFLNYQMTSQEIDNTISRIADDSEIILLCYSGQLCYLEQVIMSKLQESGHKIIGIHQPVGDFEKIIEKR